MSFINQARLKNYPRIMFVTMWSILLLNIIFHDGWKGGMGKIIGCDFLVFYSSAVLYHNQPQNLYDFYLQAEIQRGLIAPTSWGFLPYNYPPYVAQWISPIVNVSLVIAFISWSLLTLAFVIAAVYGIRKYLLPEELRKNLSFMFFGTIALSFFPFIEGFQVGQNHGLTLILLTCILIFSLNGRNWLAGIAAGFTIYKPQFAIGFLIIWLVWKNYRAITGFAIVAVLISTPTFVMHGLHPFTTYLNIMPELMQMIYQPGIGGYLEVTPFGLLASIFPHVSWRSTAILSQGVTILAGILLIWMAYLFRHKPIPERTPILILAILFPLLISPHTLLHDLVLLVPLFALWSWSSRSKRLLYGIIAIYLGTFFLVPLAYKTNIAFFAFIPIGLWIAQLRGLISQTKSESYAMGVLAR